MNPLGRVMLSGAGVALIVVFGILGPSVAAAQGVEPTPDVSLEGSLGEAGPELADDCVVVDTENPVTQLVVKTAKRMVIVESVQQLAVYFDVAAGAVLSSADGRPVLRYASCSGAEVGAQLGTGSPGSSVEVGGATVGGSGDTEPEVLGLQLERTRNYTAGALVVGVTAIFAAALIHQLGRDPV